MKPDIYLSGFCHLSPVYSCFGDTSVSSSLCASVQFRVRSGRARSRLHEVLCCMCGVCFFWIRTLSDRFRFSVGFECFLFGYEHTRLSVH